MQYFRHPELVDAYHVSLKTIHNWIDASKREKIPLKLHYYKERTYIANTPDNLLILDELASKGKKYRNSINQKTATPAPEFYTLFSRKQILDIISSITIHSEIPRQYNYFSEGATNWDQFADRMWHEKTPNLLKCTVDLLAANFNAINRLVEGYSKVNIIDIGPGNALPVRGLLEHLLEKGVLNRYVAMDISDAMLSIAGNNIAQWFGGRVSFEGYVRDVTYERFDDLLVDDMLDKDADKTINVVLLLGATPMNFQSPYDLLRVIYGSMGRNDILLYTDKPDTELERRYFAINADPGASALSSKYSYVLSLLGIDESFYNVEMGFDYEKRMRYIRIRLKVNLTIAFQFKENRRDVRLEKGDAILVWRVWHQTALELISEFEKVGFILLQSSLTSDRQYFLSISGVEAKQAYSSTN